MNNKFIVIAFFLFIILYFSGCTNSNRPEQNYGENQLNQNNEMNNVEQPNKFITMVRKNKKNVHHVSATLNESLMNKLSDSFLSNSNEKFETNTKQLNKDKSKVQITIHYKKKDVDKEYVIEKAVGSVFVEKRSYGFNGEGYLTEVTLPENNETYYVGRIFGNLLGVKKNANEPEAGEFGGDNSIWYIIFSPNNDKVYISTSVGFANYTSVLIFGNINNSPEIFKLVTSQV